MRRHGNLVTADADMLVARRAIATGTAVVREHVECR